MRKPEPGEPISVKVDGETVVTEMPPQEVVEALLRGRDALAAGKEPEPADFALVTAYLDGQEAKHPTDL